MKKKTFLFISAIVGGISTVASATVTFFQPAHAPAIVAGIGIASTATINIINLFVKEGE
jgi:hypothetical protein